MTSEEGFQKYGHVFCKLLGVRQSSEKNWVSFCPGHHDTNRSLSITLGESGKLLIRCHRSNPCDRAIILKNAGLTFADLFPERYGGNGKLGKIVDRYPYKDERGHILFWTYRYYPKDFRQCRPVRADDPKNKIDKAGRVWNLNNTRLVLFELMNLLRVRKRNPRTPVMINAGEKDVKTALRLGFLSTCNPLGEGKWLTQSQQFDFRSPFQNANSYIFPDQDGPGKIHADQVASDLFVVSNVVKMICPKLYSGKDFTDWYEQMLNQGLNRYEIDCEIKEECSRSPSWYPGIDLFEGSIRGVLNQYYLKGKKQRRSFRSFSLWLKSYVDFLYRKTRNSHLEAMNERSILEMSEGLVADLIHGIRLYTR